MPDTSILTVPDIVSIMTIASVFVILLTSTVGLVLCNLGRTQLARQIDRTLLAVLPAGYFALCFWWILSN
jgi:hypothetical protein